MKHHSVSQFFFVKGYLIIVFLLCLIVMPICENLLNMTFSKVFPLVIANSWLLAKAVIKDRNNRSQIIFDLLLMITITAGCLYFL